MADLNTLFNLGCKKRVTFIDNGKTLEFDTETIVHNYTSGIYDQLIFPGADYNPFTENIEVVLRKGSGHNNDFNGYIAHFHLRWTGSAWSWTEQAVIRAAEPNAWIISNASIAVLSTGRLICSYSHYSSAASS